MRVGHRYKLIAGLVGAECNLREMTGTGLQIICQPLVFTEKTNEAGSLNSEQSGGCV